MAEDAYADEEIALDDLEVEQDTADEDLADAVASEIAEAIDFIDNDVTSERAKSIKAYNQDLYGSEEEGRSDYVASDVRDTVLGMMPGLMRIFTGSERIVEFTPTSVEDIPNADQATDVVNHILKQNNYFNLFYAAFKDALICKTGIIKWWYDQSIEVTEHMFSGLAEMEVSVLVEAPDVELVEMTIEQEAREIITPEGIKQIVEPALYSCTIRRQSRDGKYRVEAVPPEEFLVSRQARSLDDASLIAHRQILTVSDLVAMGYDEDYVREHASSDDNLEYNQERTLRFDGEQDLDTRDDDAANKCLYIEAYIRWPNEQGIAELLRVCTIGDAYDVVNVQPCDQVPFATFCPEPIPHTVIGHSVADLTRDIQETKSEIMRDSLDSLAQSIHPRTAIVEGQVNIDDVLNNETGAVIRQRAPGMIQSFSQPFVGKDAFGMVQYLDQVKEARTGVTKASMGLSAESLQSTTATAVSATVGAAQARVELVARTFAETGLKRLFKGLLKLITKFQDKPMIVRLTNGFVPIDPRVWNSEMDVEVDVALSAATTQERAATLAMILAKQEEIFAKMGQANPLTTLGQYRNTLAKMIELSGFKDASAFFAPLPADYRMPPQQPKPTPEQVLAAVEAQSIQADIEKKKAQLMLDREDMIRRDDRARDKIEADLTIKAAELNGKYNVAVDVEAMKAGLQLDRELIKHRSAVSLEAQKAADDAALESQKAAQKYVADLRAVQ